MTSPTSLSPGQPDRTFPLARRATQIRPSGIRAVQMEAERLERQGVKVFNFSLGRPDFDTPTHIKEAAKAALDAGRVHYTPNAGIAELRRAISAKLESENGLQVDQDLGIMVTAGSCEAICVAMLGYINPGDEVLILTPAWTNYVAATLLAGGTPVEVESQRGNGFIPDPAEIRKRVTSRTRLLVLNSPNNPTGVVYPKAILRELAELADRANLLVLFDEIYERLLYDDAQHVTFATLPGMAGRTLTINGFSKSYSMTGWRIGYVAGPPNLVQPLIPIHQNLVASACSFVQWAAAHALTEASSCVADMVEKYRIRRDVVYQGLEGLAGINIPMPMGAFYAFPGWTHSEASADEVALRLLRDEHVAIVPGSVFGPGGERSLRLSFCCSTADVKEGVARVARFLGNL
jgi:aminotransferase